MADFGRALIHRAANRLAPSGFLWAEVPGGIVGGVLAGMMLLVLLLVDSMRVFLGLSMVHLGIHAEGLMLLAGGLACLQSFRCTLQQRLDTPLHPARLLPVAPEMLRMSALVSGLALATTFLVVGLVGLLAVFAHATASPALTLGWLLMIPVLGWVGVLLGESQVGPGASRLAVGMLLPLSVQALGILVNPWLVPVAAVAMGVAILINLRSSIPPAPGPLVMIGVTEERSGRALLPRRSGEAWAPRVVIDRSVVGFLTLCFVVFFVHWAIYEQMSSMYEILGPEIIILLASLVTTQLGAMQMPHREWFTPDSPTFGLPISHERLLAARLLMRMGYVTIVILMAYLLGFIPWLRWDFTHFLYGLLACLNGMVLGFSGAMFFKRKKQFIGESLFFWIPLLAFHALLISLGPVSEKGISTITLLIGGVCPLLFQLVVAWALIWNCALMWRPWLQRVLIWLQFMIASYFLQIFFGLLSI